MVETVNRKKIERETENAGAISFENIRRMDEDVLRERFKSFKERLGGSRRGREADHLLEEIDEILRRETIGDKERKKLKKLVGQVSEALGPEQNVEIKSDSAAMDRAEREIDFADAIDAIGRGEEQLAGKEKMGVASSMERRGWGKILRDLRVGDNLLVFLVPGADFLSVKNLNDNIFGPSGTDDILRNKRDVIEREFGKLGAEVLWHDYKVEMVKLPVDFKDGELIKKIAEKVDADMTEFVLRQASELLKKEKNTGKRMKIEEFVRKLNSGSEKKKGFRMTYGISKVENDDLQSKLEAISAATQAGKIAREGVESYGFEVNYGDLIKEVDNIKNKREEIIAKGNKIKDEEGNEFDIFVPRADGGGYSLNRDLIRDVRKGKFKTKQTALLKEIKVYIKKLNLVDLVKPFSFDEVEGGEVEKELEKLGTLAEDYKKDELSDKARGELMKEMSLDEKDKNFTSRHKFHQQAVKIKNCRYVSLDALDAGVDQILECEELLVGVENATDENKKKEKFKEVSLKAGDGVTQRLRDFRSTVAELVKDFTKEKTVLGLVGGDELTLAFDMDKTSAEEVDILLFKIKDELAKKKMGGKHGVEARIVQTVVAQAEKEVAEGADKNDMVAEHLQAMKKAEKGAELAKEVEELARKLSRVTKKRGEAFMKEKLGALGGLLRVESGEVKSNFVIAEEKTAGGDSEFRFKIVNREASEDYDIFEYFHLNFEEMKKEIEEILVAGKKSVKEAA